MKNEVLLFSVIIFSLINSAYSQEQGTNPNELVVSDTDLIIIFSGQDIKFFEKNQLMIRRILSQKRTRIMKNIIQIGQVTITLAKRERTKMMKSIENLYKIQIFLITIIS
jgi:hypothetical protein